MIKFLCIINSRNGNSGISHGLVCISGYYIYKEVWTAYCKELPTEREFGNVDHYAVVVKRDSSGNVPSGFESDPAPVIVKYAIIYIAQRTHKISLRGRNMSQYKNSNGF